MSIDIEDEPENKRVVVTANVSSIERTTLSFDTLRGKNVTGGIIDIVCDENITVSKRHCKR